MSTFQKFTYLQNNDFTKWYNTSTSSFYKKMQDIADKQCFELRLRFFFAILT